MALLQPTLGDRLRAGIPSVVLVVLIGWALVAGLAVGRSAAREDGLAVFDAVTPPPPPPTRVVPLRTRSSRPRGEAAPPNIQSRATELAAPVPEVPPIVPPQMVTAPIAGPGVQSSSGSTPRPGPGTGAGGIGDGYGSGGDGDGDGGDEGDYTPPRPIRGSLRHADYPEGAAEAGAQGLVTARYYVETNGRVTGCRVTRSSGNAELDATTCRLIEQRFRYRPSLDPDGVPVRSVVVSNHEWVLERDYDD